MLGFRVLEVGWVSVRLFLTVPLAAIWLLGAAPALAATPADPPLPVQEQDEPPPPERPSLEQVEQAAAEAAAEKKREERDKRRPLGSPDEKTWGQKWDGFVDGWEGITRFDFYDGMLSLRLGVDLMLDGTWVAESRRLEQQLGPLDNSVDVRRFRLRARGQILRRWLYRVSWDYGLDRGLKDAYLEGFERMFAGHARMRLGNQQEPFSLENQSSLFAVPFMENSLPVAAISPGRNFGGMVFHNEDAVRLRWAAGVFTSSNNSGDNQSQSDYQFTGRVTWLPMIRNEGRRLAQLGLSVSLRNPANGTVGYGARPEARALPEFIMTPELAASSNRLLDVEFMLVWDQLWVQSEWVDAEPDTADFGRLSFGGYYVDFGWFITGEHRSYNAKEGVIGRVIPSRSYEKLGALEFAFRYSTLDLNSGPVQSGRMADFTFGLNWYLSPGTRITANYVHSQIDGGGSANIVTLRYGLWPRMD